MSFAVKLKMGKMKGAFRQLRLYCIALCVTLQYHTELGRLGGCQGAQLNRDFRVYCHITISLKLNKCTIKGNVVLQTKLNILHRDEYFFDQA